MQDFLITYVYVFLLCLCYVYTECHKKQEKYICSRLIPASVPPDIKILYLYDINLRSPNYYTKPPFNNSAWSHIQSLHILPETFENGTEFSLSDPKLCYYRHSTLMSRSFYHLKQLQYLQLKSPCWIFIEVASFQGLEKLETLDLSYNINIDFNSVMISLNESKLFSLKNLLLKQLGANTHLIHYDIGKYLQVLKDYPLSLNLYVNKPFLYKVLTPRLTLTSLQARGITQKGYSVNMTGTFENKKNVSIGRFIYRTIPNRIITPAYVKEINRTWNILTLPVDHDDSVPLQYLDIADNNIEYINPLLFSRTRNLQHLDLSRNKLYKMSETLLNLLLRNSTKLTKFYCAENNLKKIPGNFFINNMKLKLINLTNNLLETIDFKLSHIKSLQMLNISNNKIYFLDSSAMKMFEQIAIQSELPLSECEDTTINNNTSVPNFQLIITGNSFQCSCEYLTFLHWILKQRYIIDKSTLQCSSDDKPGNKSLQDVRTLSATDYRCKLPKIITVITVLFLATVLIFGVSIYFIASRYRKKQHKMKVQEKIKNYNMRKEDKFPVFLSYSSADETFVKRWVIPGLNNSLQVKMATENNCVATGDRNFKPGKWVKEEVIRCIEISSVIVACISRNFCKSHFCCDEVMVALTTNKPVILMFLEHVHEKTMPKSIYRHFNKTTRSKWSQTKSGTYVLTPGFDILCSTIMEQIAQSDEITTHI